MRHGAGCWKRRAVHLLFLVLQLVLLAIRELVDLGVFDIDGKLLLLDLHLVLLGVRHLHVYLGASQAGPVPAAGRHGGSETVRGEVEVEDKELTAVEFLSIVFL